MTEKRFTEEEAAAIFQRAAHSEVAMTRRSSGEGMTLAELQAAGREAGLAPELVARAASELEPVPATVTERRYGRPIGVSLDLPLPRSLTDAEWEQVVVDCRRTFSASGVLRQDGSFRQWSNGNLHVLLEPDGRGGQRLRFRTMNGNARQLMDGGVFLGAIGAASLLVGVILLSFGAAASGLFGGIAALSFVPAALFYGFGALPLRWWAARRREQMKDIAERLERSISSGDV